MCWKTFAELNLPQNLCFLSVRGHFFFPLGFSANTFLTQLTFLCSHFPIDSPLVWPSESSIENTSSSQRLSKALWCYLDLKKKYPNADRLSHPNLIHGSHRWDMLLPPGLKVVTLLQCRSCLGVFYTCLRPFLFLRLIQYKRQGILNVNRSLVPFP